MINILWYSTVTVSGVAKPKNLRAQISKKDQYPSLPYYFVIIIYLHFPIGLSSINNSKKNNNNKRTIIFLLLIQFYYKKLTKSSIF